MLQISFVTIDYFVLHRTENVKGVTLSTFLSQWMLVWKLFRLVFCCSEAPVSMVFKLLLFFRPSLYFRGINLLKNTYCFH